MSKPTVPPAVMAEAEEIRLLMARHCNREHGDLAIKNLELEAALQAREQDRDGYKLAWQQQIELCTQMTDALKAKLHEARAAAQKAEHRLKTLSTIEIMCENPSVDSHVREWEKRCLSAEAKLRAVEAERDEALRNADPGIEALQEYKRRWQAAEARAERPEKALDAIREGRE